MGNKMKKVLFLLLFPLLTAGGFEIACNGKSQAVIVIPDEAILPEKYAAKELKYHLEKISGAEFVICSEKDAPAKGNRIFLGNTRAAAQAGIFPAKMAIHHYVIKTGDNSLFLAGFDRSVKNTLAVPWNGDSAGTLFAVYDFLEKEFGVRWLFPGESGEIIPRKREVKIGKIDRRGKPFFTYARLMFPKADAPYHTGWADMKNCRAYYEAQEKFLLRHRITGMAYGPGGGHAFTTYWKKYGEKHPEYFALLPNGKRAPVAGDVTGKYIPLCVSNEALQQRIVENWQKDPRRQPGNIPFVPELNACENDSPGMCVCEMCRSWDGYDITKTNNNYWARGIHPLTQRTRFGGIASAAWGEDGVLPGCSGEEYPSVTDRYCRFYMALLEKAKAIDPSARVIVYAYANYRQAPCRVKLAPELLVSYVPNTFFPYTCKAAEAEYKNILAWKKAGAGSFCFRPNYTNAGANLPVLYTRQIARDFNFIAANGFAGAIFDSLSGAWSAQGPMLYVLCRMFIDPSADVEKILQEYYDGFGKAAPVIKEYFDYFQQISDNVAPEEFRQWSLEEKDHNGMFAGTFKNFVRISHRMFSEKDFAHAGKLLDEAEKLAAGDEIVLKRIAFLRKGLRDAELTVAVRRAQSKFEKSGKPKDKSAFQTAFAKLKKYRASVEGDFICNYSAVASKERSGSFWPWERIRTTTAK